MIKKSMFAVCGLLFAVGALAASTNLNYTVSQINDAIGYGLENSNSLERVNSMEAFIAGSNGFSNIEYTTSEISNALAIAEDNVFTTDRVDGLEDAVAESAVLLITNAVVSSSFSTTLDAYSTIDLSGVIGSNSAIVMLTVTPSGSLSTDYNFYCRDASEVNPVYAGAGHAELAVGSPSSVITATDADGAIEASSETAVDIEVQCAVVLKGEL